MTDGPGTTRSVMTSARQTRLVTSGMDITSWLKHLPSAEDVRPTHCPACGAASRVLGSRSVCGATDCASAGYVARRRPESR
jgi:hypothetical protein